MTPSRRRGAWAFTMAAAESPSSGGGPRTPPARASGRGQHVGSAAGEPEDGAHDVRRRGTGTRQSEPQQHGGDPWARRTAQLEAALERSRAEVAALARQLDEERTRGEAHSAAIGHELRNPIAAIMTAVALQKRVTSAEPQLVRTRDVIARQSAFLLALVDGLSELSRIARGKLRVASARVRLDALCAAVVAEHRAAAAKKGLRLDYDERSGAAVVRGDVERLRAVLRAVVDNAVRYTSSGTVKVGLARRQRELVVRVSDTGAGLGPGEVEHLFEPFAVARPSASRGLGLGLARARGIVALHGGSLAVESAGPGQGTVVCIALPESRGAVPTRVLIVEDDMDVAELLNEALTERGHAVDVAADFDAAVACARERPPSLVLCDLSLTDRGSGFAVAVALRRLPALSGACFVAVTGYDADAVAERARAAGFDACLTKPVSLERIERLLDARPQAASLH